VAPQPPALAPSPPMLLPATVVPPTQATIPERSPPAVLVLVPVGTSVLLATHPMAKTVPMYPTPNTSAKPMVTERPTAPVPPPPAIQPHPTPTIPDRQQYVCKTLVPLTIAPVLTPLQCVALAAIAVPMLQQLTSMLVLVHGHVVRSHVALWVAVVPTLGSATMLCQANVLYDHHPTPPSPLPVALP
jgi:hypothetical protein